MENNKFSLDEHLNSSGEEGSSQDKKDYSFSLKEKGKAKEVLREVTKLPEEFDLSKVSDINFLLSIFAEPYDKFKSLEYLTKMRGRLLKQGYPETPILNEYLFWTTISRRLQIEYQIIHVKLVKKDRIEAEPLGMLKTMKGVAEQVTSLQKALNDTFERYEKVSGIADLHQETLDEIEKFLQEHIGEYSFKCRQCGSIVNTQGLPHWAIEKRDEPTGEKVYFIFSPELWYLYRKKLLPLHVLAFALRTSVEGILITAKRRGERIGKIGDIQISDEENRSKKLLLEFEKTEK